MFLPRVVSVLTVLCGRSSVSGLHWALPDRHHPDRSHDNLIYSPVDGSIETKPKTADATVLAEFFDLGHVLPTAHELARSMPIVGEATKIFFEQISRSTTASRQILPDCSALATSTLDWK
jgi:hypothetical protein